MDNSEGENNRENLEVVKKGEEEEKSCPLLDSRVDHIEQLLKESSMFNNYFNNYVGFTYISIGKLPLKFSMPDIKFHETQNPNHHVRT